MQLNSLALRGLAPTANISLDRMDAANVAVASAVAALKFLLHESDIRAGIIGVPLFKHAMFTFSAVFLLKVSCQWNRRLHIDQTQALDLVQGVVDLLRGFSINRRHLLYHIANGLAESVQRIRAKTAQDAGQTQPHTESTFLAPAATGNGVSQQQQQQQQPPPPQSMVDPHLATLFDDFGVVDGLNLAANDWLLYGSLDAYSVYLQDTAPMIWDTDHDNSTGVGEPDSNLQWH